MFSPVAYMIPEWVNYTKQNLELVVYETLNMCNQITLCRLQSQTNCFIAKNCYPLPKTILKDRLPKMALVDGNVSLLIANSNYILWQSKIIVNGNKIINLLNPCPAEPRFILFLFDA